MRARLAIIVGLAAVLGVYLQVAPLAHAGGTVLAQEVGEDQGDANVDEGTVTDPSRKSGANEEEATTPAEPEAGPPWTYQMARMAMGLLVVVFLVVGFTYYQFVYRRQKGAH